MRNRKAEATSLASLEHSEARTLECLHSCLDQIASQVDALGFPVPTASRTLDALDDLNNLFAKHVHAVKQEIQSMEISAQMMSVASERTESMRGIHEKSDPLNQVAALTEELMRLQQQVQTLFTRRDTLSAQVEVAEATSRSSSASAPPVSNPMPSLVGGSASATPTPTPSLDAYSTFAQSGSSSSTDVFSVTSSVTNAPSDTKADDPWAALAAPVPAPPVVTETASKLHDGLGLSASLPSLATSDAFADDWGTFSAPPSQQESVLATPVPSTADKNETTTKPAAISAFADDWGTFSAPTSQQENAQATPEPASTDAAKQADDLTLPSSLMSPVTPNAFTDEWGTFSSTPSQEQNGSVNVSASADPFGFGSPVAAASPSPAGATLTTDATGSAGQPAAAAKDEFGWGDFQ